MAAAIGWGHRMRLTAALFALTLSAGSAQAHPHVIIDYTATLLFGERGPTGIRFTWVFDEIYSAVLRTDFAKGDATKLSPQAVKTIHDKAFANLVHFNYFLEIRQGDDAPLKIDKVADFDAMFANKRAVYQFTVPLGTGDSGRVEIAAFDAEFYVHYILSASRPYGVEKADGFEVNCEAKRGTLRETAGWGTIDTDAVACTWRRKP